MQLKSFDMGSEESFSEVIELFVVKVPFFDPCRLDVLLRIIDPGRRGTGRSLRFE